MEKHPILDRIKVPVGTIHAFRSSLATLFLLGHCRSVQRWLERLPGRCSEESRFFQKALPGWVPVIWRLVPPRPVSAGHGAGITSVLAPAPPHQWLYSHVLWGGIQHRNCCQGEAPCICHLGSAGPGDLNIQKRTQKWGFGGRLAKQFGHVNDKCRENANFLRANLQLYVWNLLEVSIT